MFDYQIKDFGTGGIARLSVIRSDGTSIPPAIGNSDFSLFVTEWKSGADVTGPDGDPLTYTDAAAEAIGLPFI